MEKMKPESVERLNEIIREQNVTQKQLADLVKTTPQTINKACRGERLTKDMAESIVKAFPDAGYNVAWLLGYSRHKTIEDQERSIQLFKDTFEEVTIKRRAELTIVLAKLYLLAGFPTTYNAVSMTVKDHDGKSITLQMDELKELEDDIFAFLKYRLRKLIEKGR